MNLKGWPFAATGRCGALVAALLALSPPAFALEAPTACAERLAKCRFRHVQRNLLQPRAEHASQRTQLHQVS